MGSSAAADLDAVTGASGNAGYLNGVAVLTAGPASLKARTKEFQQGIIPRILQRNISQTLNPGGCNRMD